jgi:alpha-beta hydrolase superfamily lysophospholipase
MSTSISTPNISSTEAPLAGRGAMLHRISVQPHARSLARVAIVHGYGEHSGRYAEFMKWMAGRGVACYSFDFRGHGRSSGRRGYVRRWDEYIDDLRTFLAQPELRASDSVPLFLLGHSHGGLVVIAAAVEGVRELEGVAGAVLTNPYLRNAVPVSACRRLMARVIDRLVPWARFSSRVRPEWLTSDPRMRQDTINDPLAHRCATPRWFLTVRQAQHRVMERATSFRMPMLMMIGLRDCVARPEVCQRFYDRAGSPDKSLKLYPDMVHELLRDSERERAFADIFDWIARRLPS